MKIKLDSYSGNASTLQVSFDGGETYTKTLPTSGDNNSLSFDPNSDGLSSLEDIRIKGDGPAVTPDFDSRMEMQLINRCITHYEYFEWEWIDLASYPIFVNHLIEMNNEWSSLYDNYDIDNAYLPYHKSAYLYYQVTHETEGFPRIYDGGDYKFNFDNLQEEQKEPVALGLLCFLNNIYSSGNSGYWANNDLNLNKWWDKMGINVDLSTFPDINWTDIPGCEGDNWSNCNRQYNFSSGLVSPLFGRSLAQTFYMYCNNAVNSQTPVPLYIPKGYQFPDDLVIDMSQVRANFYVHEEDVDNLLSKIQPAYQYTYHGIQINIIPSKEGLDHTIPSGLYDCSGINLSVLWEVRNGTQKEQSHYYSPSNQLITYLSEEN